MKYLRDDLELLSRPDLRRILRDVANSRGLGTGAALGLVGALALQSVRRATLRLRPEELIRTILDCQEYPWRPLVERKKTPLEELKQWNEEKQREWDGDRT